MKTKECYQRLSHLLGAGEQAVTATVVGSKGSTPREPGAKMLIRSDGTIEGTIGGGCGEADVIEVARQMLGRGEDGFELVQVDLTEDMLESSDRICGGIMEIAVECWTHPVQGSRFSNRGILLQRCPRPPNVRSSSFRPHRFHT